MLNALRSHPLAYRIGTVCVGAPTTADDTALISASETGMKVLVGIAAQDARIQRYSYSTQKTKLMVINQKDNKPISVQLNGERIAMTCQERHLGVERTTSDSPKATISSRIKEARRALYRLAGAGLHGLNGVGPRVSIHMFSIYVLPILTYGLEALVLESEHYQILEHFYKNILRRLQHLPDNTATPAIYILLGCIPLEGQLHIKLLTYYGSILRNIGSAEYEIVKRQLAVKELSSNSWVNQIRRVLSKYALPSAYKLLLSPPEKNRWKSQVTSAVATHWLEDLQLKARSMNTLKLMDLDNLQYGKVADVWRHNADPIDAHMATVKTRMLVQRYPLGYSYCAGAQRSSICALCGGEEETLEHFLLTCPSLAKTRRKCLYKLDNLAVDNSVHLPNGKDETLRFVLTPALYMCSDLVPLFEQATRQLVYRLHCTRSSIIGQG